MYAKGFGHKDVPIILSEFGGIGFGLSGEGAWGYTAAGNEEEFLNDYEKCNLADLWAPEIFYLGSAWYIYFAARIPW